MIETDHQITCDKCEDDGKEVDPIHSSIEFGPITIGEFRRRLGLLGWVNIGGRDLCPSCNRKRRERRRQFRYTDKPCPECVNHSHKAEDCNLEG